MKASELRIGNYISKQGNNERIGHLQGGGILDEKINNSQIYEQNHQPVFQPIPLTEEWLVKFDLLLNTKSDEIVTYDMIPFQDFTFVLQKNEQGRVQFNNYHICYVNYVHQLQNLYFALTGEELTIKEPVI